MFRSSITVFSICLALFVSQKALASEGATACYAPAFAISNISIDAEGTTGTQARKTGQDRAVTEAFDRLITRMVIPEQVGAVGLDELAPDGFVDFIHINTENALPRRYIANVDICFDPTKIRAAFIQAGVKWSELVSPPILLLPVWREPAGIRVWARNIAWLDGWRQFKADDDSLVRFVLFEPSLEVERRLPAESVLAKEADILARAAQEADALQLAWIYTGLDYSSVPARLVLEAELYDSDGELLALLDGRDFHLDGQLNLQSAFADYRAEIIRQIDNRWRTANLYRLSDQKDFYVQVDVSNLQGWLNARRVLSSQPVVSSLTPVSLRGGTGVLRLRLSGPVETLELAVRTAGFRLDIEEGQYRLRVDPTP